MSIYPLQIHWHKRFMLLLFFTLATMFLIGARKVHQKMSSQSRELEVLEMKRHFCSELALNTASGRQEGWAELSREDPDFMLRASCVRAKP